VVLLLYGSGQAHTVDLGRLNRVIMICSAASLILFV